MNKRIRLTIIIALLFNLGLSACSPSISSENSAPDDQPSGVISISGAFAIYPLMTLWAEEFAKTYPDVQFDISAGGAGKGMTDALSGAVDIGMVSRSIKVVEEEQGAYWVSVSKDGVFPVINENNPVVNELIRMGVTQETFEKIYITGEIKTWGEVVGKPEITDEIHVYTRSDAAGAPEMWAKFLGDYHQEDLLGIGINADPGMLQAVIADPLGIGYNNLSYAYDASSGLPVSGAIVLPVDFNNNGTAETVEYLETKQEAIEMVASGEYPSPPSRDLNLVTNGKPTGLTKLFIQWILTDGQQFVGDAGYVKLTQELLDEMIKKVD